MKEWSKQKTLSQELNPQCCPPNSIVHQISFLNQEIQHLKYQINIIELNLRRVYEFSQKMFCQCSHLSTPNTNDSTDILNLKELGIRISGIESRLRESANRQEFIMHDIEKISNRILTVESTLQVQFDRESCSMGEIPSANCSESHCEAKFHAQYDRIYHRKHVHNKLDDA